LIGFNKRSLNRFVGIIFTASSIEDIAIIGGIIGSFFFNSIQVLTPSIFGIQISKKIMSNWYELITRNASSADDTIMIDLIPRLDKS
jgi:hypothetical protein